MRLSGLGFGGGSVAVSEAEFLFYPGVRTLLNREGFVPLHGEGALGLRLAVPETS